MTTDIYISQPIQQVRSLFSQTIQKHPSHEKVVDYLREIADQLWFNYFSGNLTSTIPISLHHPGFIGESPNKIMAAGLKKEEIDLAILLEHGFGSWAEAKNAQRFNLIFEKAINALLDGKLETLRAIINSHPQVIKFKSSFGHQAGLIHYLAANGTELWRQVVSHNAPELMSFLLENGCDPDQDNALFGGSDMLSLIETSEACMMAGVADEMILRLQSF